MHMTDSLGQIAHMLIYEISEGAFVGGVAHVHKPLQNDC